MLPNPDVAHCELHNVHMLHTNFAMHVHHNSETATATVLAISTTAVVKLVATVLCAAESGDDSTDPEGISAASGTSDRGEEAEEISGFSS